MTSILPLRAAAFGLALAALPTLMPAKAEAFSCRNAAFASERTICNNPGLGDLDARMSSLYRAVQRQAETSSEREGIRRYQVRFLAARDACGRDTNCIRGAYLDQIEVLRTRLQGYEQ